MGGASGECAEVAAFLVLVVVLVVVVVIDPETKRKERIDYEDDDDDEKPEVQSPITDYNHNDENDDEFGKKPSPFQGLFIHPIFYRVLF